LLPVLRFAGLQLLRIVAKDWLARGISSSEQFHKLTTKSVGICIQGYFTETDSLTKVCVVFSSLEFRSFFYSYPFFLLEGHHKRAAWTA
jgi:hypothetical protein